MASAAAKNIKMAMKMKMASKSICEAKWHQLKAIEMA